MKLSVCFATAGGMSGRMLVAAEDPCPSVLPAPYQLGKDISPNGVVCANFKCGFNLVPACPLTCPFTAVLYVCTQHVYMLASGSCSECVYSSSTPVELV